MKIIDFDKRGNLVRFYLNNSGEAWGDDWDDIPYEHNAGSAYDQYVEGYVDIVFPFEYVVLEPQDDWHNRGNSDYSKEDMLKRKVPCIIALKVEDQYDFWKYDNCFGNVISDDKAVKFYFGDEINNNFSHELLKYSEENVDRINAFITKRG